MWRKKANKRPEKSGEYEVFGTLNEGTEQETRGRFRAYWYQEKQIFTPIGSEHLDLVDIDGSIEFWYDFSVVTTPDTIAGIHGLSDIIDKMQTNKQRLAKMARPDNWEGGEDKWDKAKQTALQQYDVAISLWMNYNDGGHGKYLDKMRVEAGDEVFFAVQAANMCGIDIPYKTMDQISEILKLSREKSGEMNLKDVGKIIADNGKKWGFESEQI